jgi:hypothetical protein
MMMLLDEARVMQRTSALQEANRIRTARKNIKAQLADGEVELAELIRNPPEEIATVKLGDLLMWMPGIGHFRAGKILTNGHGAPLVGRGVHLEHLSERTRERVIARLELTTPVHFPTA